MTDSWILLLKIFKILPVRCGNAIECGYFECRWRLKRRLQNQPKVVWDLKPLTTFLNYHHMSWLFVLVNCNCAKKWFWVDGILSCLLLSSDSKGFWLLCLKLRIPSLFYLSENFCWWPWKGTYQGIYVNYAIYQYVTGFVQWFVGLGIVCGLVDCFITFVFLVLLDLQN